PLDNLQMNSLIGQPPVPPFFEGLFMQPWLVVLGIFRMIKRGQAVQQMRDVLLTVLRLDDDDSWLRLVRFSAARNKICNGQTNRCEQQHSAASHPPRLIDHLQYPFLISVSALARSRGML